MSSSVTLDPKLRAKVFPGAILERRERNRLPRQYYLIVCEGTKTEPNYFGALRMKLPGDMIKRIIIEGAAANTLTLIKVAEKECDRRRRSGEPPYDKVWLVFDKDSFDDDKFDNAISSAKSHTESGKCEWQ